MAKFRQVHTTFWDDGFVLDLTPEEKYFYLYLMTNSNTTQCGIYELPYRVIEMQTGYNRDTVLKLLKRFIDYEKISYNESTKEIMIINWAKYNFINSPKVKKCIEKELHNVKHLAFVNEYLGSLEHLGYSLDTVSIPYKSISDTKELKDSNINGSIPYRYPIDSPSIDLGEEEEQQQEQQQEEEKEKEQQQQVRKSMLSDSRLSELVKFYDGNIQRVNGYIHECIQHMTNENNPELLMEAFKITAVNQPNSPLKYIESILRSWRNEFITNVEELKAKGARDVAKSRGSNKQEQRTAESEFGFKLDF